MIGIVAVGEHPYAEGEGDNPVLTLSEKDVFIIHRMRQQVEKLIVVQISGRPLVIGDLVDLADAWVCAWLPGTEGQGIVDVLVGDVPFTGKLSFSIPKHMPPNDGHTPLFPIGYGLTV